MDIMTRKPTTQPHDASLPLPLKHKRHTSRHVDDTALSRQLYSNKMHTSAIEPMATDHSPRLGLGDDIINDDVDHGSGRERQRVRQQRCCHGDGKRSQQARYWLHHAAELAVPDSSKNEHSISVEIKIHRRTPNLQSKFHHQYQMNQQFSIAHLHNKRKERFKMTYRDTKMQHEDLNHDALMPHRACKLINKATPDATR